MSYHLVNRPADWLIPWQIEARAGHDTIYVAGFGSRDLAVEYAKANRIGVLHG